MNIDTRKLNNIGYDRLTMEVDILAIDTARLNDCSIGYASDDDNICMELYDKADDTVKRVKNLKAYCRVDGCLLSDTEKDTIKYSVTVCQRRNVATNSTYTTAILDVVLGRVAYATVHNVYNVYDNETLINALEQIHRELCLNGIELDEPTEWLVTSMEINKTVEINYPLSQNNSLSWAFGKLYNSGKYKSRSEIQSRNVDGTSSMTYTCRTKRRDMKIYDKTAHLKDTLNIFIDESLARCEITLNKEAIFKAFKSLSVSEVLFNRDTVEAVYNGFLKDICSTLKTEMNKSINDLYKQFTRTGSKELSRIYAYNSTDIFDMVILVEAGLKAYKDYGKKNSDFNRDIKKLLTIADPNHRHRYKELLEILTAFDPGAELIALSKPTYKYI